MFQIQITYHAAINSIVYETEAAAQAAYEKISNALREYRLFKNDRVDTVEVETDDGKSTFRLERMDAISIGKIDKCGPLDRIKLEREKMLREMRVQMGLPETILGEVESPHVTGDPVGGARE